MMLITSACHSYKFLKSLNSTRFSNPCQLPSIALKTILLAHSKPGHKNGHGNGNLTNLTFILNKNTHNSTFA